ncbi:MAG: CoA-binding protein [Nanoarchaeota archaeon]|nr:CoA-binding protein [Nanoarchaeota archaeon]
MRIAIIGASKDRSKFSNKAVRAYKEQNHVVFPVNPHEKEIEGLTCYSSVLDIPIEVDAASIYLPPEIGLKVVDDIAKKGIHEVFINPGAESEEIIGRLKSLGITPTLACSIRAIGADPAKV